MDRDHPIDQRRDALLARHLFICRCMQHGKNFVEVVLAHDLKQRELVREIRIGRGGRGLPQ